MSESDFVIQLAGLCKTFPIGFSGRKRLEALRGIDFGVRRGQLFGFLGPNGAGKSTTIKVLAGLLFPTCGSVRVFDGSPQDPEMRRRFGYLPENPAFHDHLTGREALSFMGALLGLDGSRARKRADEMLELTGLSRAADIHVRRYSKGMVQRLGIAQALLHDPELVILDEPMSGLDPVGRREVKDIIRELRAQGRTVFFSTHIVGDVEELCDELVILLGGKVVRAGAVRQLIEDSTRQYEVVANNVPTSYVTFPARSRSDNREVFVASDESQARQIIESLWAAGATIHALNVRRHSLEDLFMKEIGKGPVGGKLSYD